MLNSVVKICLLVKEWPQYTRRLSLWASSSLPAQRGKRDDDWKNVLSPAALRQQGRTGIKEEKISDSKRAEAREKDSKIEARMFRTPQSGCQSPDPQKLWARGVCCFKGAKLWYLVHSRRKRMPPHRSWSSLCGGDCKALRRSSRVSVAGRPAFQSLSCQGVWPWTNHLVSLSLRFLTCKTVDH